MNKNLKLLMLCILVLNAILLTSCKKRVANDDKTLEIYSYMGGYGTGFLEELAERFEQLYPGIKVEISGDSAPDKVKTMLLAGPSNTTVDLMFSGENFFQLIDQGANAINGYDCILEPLDDVYNYKLENENITIKEKMHDSYEKYHRVKKDGEIHYYSYSWANSLTGLIYNDTKFKQFNLEVPLTTNDLIKQADAIKSYDEVPFIFSTLTGYWEYLRETWHVQYEGYENYSNFYKGIDNGRYSKEIFKQKGRLYSLEVIEQIVSDTYKRSHVNVNSMNYAQAQSKFLLGEGLMMPNGDWFENETSIANSTNENPQNFKFMKTPIISKIIEKTPTIKDEEMLKEVIKYVDNTIDTVPNGVSEEDIKIIYDARHMIHTIGTNHNAVIPAYATAKDLAKKFLIFMSSDEGLKIYRDNTSGNSLPFDFDVKEDKEFYNGLSEFQKSKYEILENSVFAPTNYPIVYRGGLGAYTGKRKISEVLLAAKNESDKKTALEIYNDEINYYTDSVWNSLLTRAKLNN